MTLQADSLNMMGLGESYVSLIDALSAIRELSEVSLNAVTEEELLQLALSSLARYQDLEHGALFLIDGELLRCTATIELAEQFHPFPFSIKTNFPDSIEYPLGEGLIGIAGQTRQLQLCADCGNDERYLPLAGKQLFCDSGSLIAAPLAINEDLLGVLVISHPMRDFFDTWQGYFLTLFANCLGRFIHTHRLLHNLEQVVQARTQELEQALKESEDLRNRYQRLSITDDLTGLHNRRYFFAEGESMLARAVGYALPLGLLLVDVDHFKRINDRWGHVVGDRVLKLIAGVLRDQARSGDLIARLGGEEFVMMLPNTGPVGTDLMAKGIQERIGRLDLGGEMGALILTVSIGMTSLDCKTSDTPADTMQLLYKQADEAMYLCKAQGRNRRLFYSSEIASEQQG